MALTLRQGYATNRRLRRFSGLLLLILLVGGYLLYTFLSLCLTSYRTARELQYYESQKRALLQEREQLQAEIKRLQSDAYIERVAREELGWVKPDETIILKAQPGEVRPLVLPKGEEFRD